MHDQDVTRILSAALLALTLAACGDAGGGGGDGEPAEKSACVQTAECMERECVEAFESFVAACGCAPDGTSCTMTDPACNPMRSEADACFSACEVSPAVYGEEAYARFRSCLARSAEECDDAMLACEAAP